MATLACTPTGTTGNLFLDSLDAETFASLSPHLETAEVTSGVVLTRSREVIKHIVFPLTSAISVVTRMKDGSDVEAMLIGREGFHGLPVVLGDNVSAGEALAQIPGAFLRIATSDFMRCFESDAALRTRTLSYAHATIEMIAQFSACNRLHAINERGARWLLMAHDRADGDTVFITHEFLATMLGVRRPGVSIATAALDQAGYIESHRGRIIIRDRVGLESVSCECYGVVNASLQRIVGYNVRKDCWTPKTRVASRRATRSIR